MSCSHFNQGFNKLLASLQQALKTHKNYEDPERTFRERTVTHFWESHNNYSHHLSQSMIDTWYGFGLASVSPETLFGQTKSNQIKIRYQI